MKRGEVYLVNLSPAVGTELRDPHWCLVVQADILEHELRPRSIVVPFTSKAPKRPLPYSVTVDPPEGGLTQRSYALCDQITRIDKSRILRRAGTVTGELMARIDEALRLVLDL